MKEYVFLFPELSLEEVFEIAVDDLMRCDTPDKEFSEKFAKLTKEYDAMKEDAE